MAVRHTEMMAMLRRFGATHLNFGHRNLGEAAADIIEDQDDFIHSMRDFIRAKGLWDEYYTGKPT